MGNWNTKDDYDDYNAPDSAGVDRFGSGGYSTYGDGDGSSVVESFMSDMFGNVRPNVYDRFALNISPGNIVDQLNLTNTNSLDRFMNQQANPYSDGPVRGTVGVYDPMTGGVHQIIDDNSRMDAIGTGMGLFSPLTNAIGAIDTAKLSGGMNYRNATGFLGEPEIVSDAQIEEELQIAEQNRKERADSNEYVTPDYTGGLLARNDQGDIPWYVLANAGLLAI